MTDTVIRQIAQDVWTFSRPFARGGVFPIGGRSTAVRLRNGGVWVLASTPLDTETKTKLDELGNVTYIASGDALHWLYLDDYKKAYPSAKLIGVEPLLTKKKCPKLDGAYGHDPPETKYGYEDEVCACAFYFPGFKNKDVAFHHIPTKTLIVADLLFNLPPTEQYSKQERKPFLFKFTLSPYQWLHRRAIRSASVDVEAMKRDSRTVAAWDIDRIIPCHGDVIESSGKQAWRAAYKAFLI
ncbi:hypothetical protein JB92DRAFT_3083399 [Gautieria morchelliformis]|nr:hypothetical protein JB92DRAFT_3083399 [Gautieria morchelliformis]